MRDFIDGAVFGGGLVFLGWLCVYLGLRDKMKAREREAFNERAQIGIDNAAMKAYDMGRPDIREEINAMWERAS